MGGNIQSGCMEGVCCICVYTFLLLDVGSSSSATRHEVLKSVLGGDGMVDRFGVSQKRHS